MERELVVSQHVKASTLEEVNLGTTEEPWHVSVAKEIRPVEKMTLVELLKEYKDVFTWSSKDMKGLDPQFYQHQIHFNKDAKLVTQI